MARVGQYKALGSKLGGYRKTLSDVGAKEYAKQHESFKGEQQRAMYSTIGTTVANIIGIAGEYSKAQELKGYGESAKQLRGVGKREVEYQPLGKFGEKIGLKQKKREEYFFGDTGQSLSEKQLQDIGYLESLGMETKYSQSKYAERPDVEPTLEEPEELGYEALDPLYQDPSTVLPSEPWEKPPPSPSELAKFDPVEPQPAADQPSIIGVDPLGTREMQEKMKAQLSPEELEGYGSESWHFQRRMEGAEKRGPGTTTAGQRGVQSTVIGGETVAGQETKDYPSWMPEGIDPEFAGMIERERGEGYTPFGHVVKQKKRETHTPIGTLSTPTETTDVETWEDVYGKGAGEIEKRRDLERDPSGKVFEAVKGSEGAFDISKSAVASPKEVKSGYSELEKNIAMAENAPFFESGGKEGGMVEDVYARGEVDLSKGEKRLASGFGTIRGKGETEISFDEATKRLRGTIKTAQDSLKGEFKDFSKFTQPQQDALTEMVYQLGWSKVKKQFPSMIKAIQKGDWKRAYSEATWNFDEDRPSKWVQQTEKRAKRVAGGFLR